MNSAIKALKHTISDTVHDVSFKTGISRYKTLRSPSARVIMFHGIGGPDCPADIFESQMRYLKENYPVISLKKALAVSSDINDKFRTDVVLTFDDGLRNNFTTAYPILSRYQLPATFFVCPGLIESQKWQWVYEIEQRLLICSEIDLESIGKLFNIVLPTTKGNNSRDIVEILIDHMKTMETEHRMKFENTIRALTKNFEATSLQRDSFDTMNWDELCSLPPDLVTIGSHTVNHPILTKIPYEEMRYQIKESRQWLEKRLNRPVEYFCYPNGNYDASIVSVVAENYKSAVSTNPGFFDHGDDVYQINRIPAADSLPLFAWRMFRP